MTGFLIRRVIQTMVVTFIVTLIHVALVHLVPGGEVRALLGLRATPAEVAADSNAWGFDQPLYVQYVKWLWQLLHGNFGFDIKHSPSVSTCGPAAADRRAGRHRHRGRAADRRPARHLPGGAAVHGHRPRVTGIGFIGYGSPTFFVGLLLVQWFAIDLHLFPPFAPQATTIGAILSDPVALVLPVATYAFVRSRCGAGSCAPR